MDLMVLRVRIKSTFAIRTRAAMAQIATSSSMDMYAPVPKVNNHSSILIALITVTTVENINYIQQA